jgi:NifU-like protein involved in Fe-S cluster formation
MDELVIRYYRRLLREGFEHAGSLENPSIFLDTVGEKIRICGSSTHNYMKIYADIRDGVIKDIRYLCTCDPTANVVVELLCSLVKGRTIAEAEALKKEDFLKRSGDIIELLNRGLARYKSGDSYTRVDKWVPKRYFMKKCSGNNNTIGTSGFVSH